MGLNGITNLRIKIELNSKGKFDVYGNPDFVDIMD